MQINFEFWGTLVSRLLIIVVAAPPLFLALRREKRAVYQICYALLLNGGVLECLGEIVESARGSHLPMFSTSYYLVAVAMMTVPLTLLKVRSTTAKRNQRLAPAASLGAPANSVADDADVADLPMNRTNSPDHAVMWTQYSQQNNEPERNLISHFSGHLRNI